MTLQDSVNWLCDLPDYDSIEDLQRGLQSNIRTLNPAFDDDRLGEWEDIELTKEQKRFLVNKALELIVLQLKRGGVIE